MSTREHYQSPDGLPAERCEQRPFCAACVAYVARRDARIAARAPARAEAPGCARAADKAPAAPQAAPQAVELPRGRRGLLSGISGPLSTRRAGVRLSMLGGALAWRVDAQPQDLHPMESRGAHVAPAPVPATATHASVEREVRADADATHAPTRMHLTRGMIARERGL